MCIACDISDSLQEPSSTLRSSKRRSLLGFAGAASLAGMFSMGMAHANAPAKPENELKPDEAIARLMAGNERYISGKTEASDYAQTRKALSKSQNPYAGILSCADSRISPELCFDEERGDLFVTRVAGNFVNTDILASLEYGTAVLGASVIMVLGHTRCGAIDAAVQAYTKNVAYPGHIQTLTTALAPAVREASKRATASELVAASTLENVRQNVKRLQESNPIISARVAEGKLKIVGGLYELTTGRVSMVS